MAWIAFDEKTRNALREFSGAPVKLERGSRDPLSYALNSTTKSVVLLPDDASDQIWLLTIKRNLQPEAPVLSAPPAEQHSEHSVHYLSGGFLGLSDEVALEEQPEERKNWWKKWFD